LFEHFSQDATVGMASCRSGHDHVVHGFDAIATEPEGLTDLAPDSVAIDRSLRDAARHGHAESRLVRGLVVNPEEFVAAGTAPGENRLELRAAEQARGSRQAAPLQHWPGALPARVGGQAFATLGAAGVDDRATRLGGHARTETVATKALDSAGLECPFHDRIRKLLKIVMTIE